MFLSVYLGQECCENVNFGFLPDPQQIEVTPFNIDLDHIDYCLTYTCYTMWLTYTCYTMWLTYTCYTKGG